MRDRRRVSVLIPVLDEAATIGAVLERIDALSLDAQIIVVDDGSTDATPEILSGWLARGGSAIAVRQINRGKGAAIRTALTHATAGICVIQDADAEYDPADLPRLVEPIAQGRADAVYGSRLLPDAPQAAFGRRQLLGNRVISRATRLLYRTTLSDVETGSKAFRTAALRALPLAEDGFAIEVEITAWACRTGLRIAEVPIAYRPRSYAEGKKITWRDGVRALWVLVVCRVRGRPGRTGDPTLTSSAALSARGGG
jgi:glycosyltransferase involved in cell wall biosynthesis